MKKARIGIVFLLLFLIIILLGAIYVVSPELFPFLPDISIQLPFNATATLAPTSTPLPDYAATLSVEATQTQSVFAAQTQVIEAQLTEEAGVIETAIAVETQVKMDEDIATAIVIVTQIAQETQAAYETEVAFVIALETEQAQATETQIVQLTLAAMATPTPSFEVTMRNIDGMEMVFVKQGNFSMGARYDDDPARDDEMPMHTVYLDSYYIDRFEVTTSQYAKYLNANPLGKKWMPSNNVSHMTNVNGYWQGEPGYEDHPVTNIIWRGAMDYCNWVGGSLPTEAQWEKAARSDDERRYPWGNEFKSVPIRLNFYDAEYSFMDDGYVMTAPVGQYPEGMSPYGVMDMGGNVWEWTADWFAPLYDKREGKLTENPLGGVGGDGKVLRGGSYNSSFLDFRTTERRLSDDPIEDLGWRCVINP